MPGTPRRRVRRLENRYRPDRLEIQAEPEGHLSPIGNGWWPHGGAKSEYDPQPIEPTALLLASEAALDATGEHRCREAMERAYRWFLGGNRVHRQVADPVHGACFDGLTRDGVNANEGAESTLMWLMAAERIRAIREADQEAVATAPAVDPTRREPEPMGIVDKRLASMEAAVDALIPLDWTFYGPIRRSDGSWIIGVRSTRDRLLQVEVLRPSLTDAFEALTLAIQRSGLKPRKLH